MSARAWNCCRLPRRWRAIAGKWRTRLSVCLMPTRGFGNRDVAAAFTPVPPKSANKSMTVPRLFGHRGNGQYHMISATCDRRVLALAERMDDHGFLIEAHHLGWSALCFSGDSPQRHAEGITTTSAEERDHCLTYIYSGHDPGVCCRAFGSLSLARLGRPLALCRERLALADRRHPFTIAIALWQLVSFTSCGGSRMYTRAAGERIVAEQRACRHGAARQGLSW